MEKDFEHYTAGAITDPDCPIHASSFQSTIPVPFPLPSPATATPGIGAMPRPATVPPVTQLGEAAVANASDGQSGYGLARSRYGGDCSAGGIRYPSVLPDLAIDWMQEEPPRKAALPDLLPVPEVSPPCPLPQTFDDQPWQCCRGQEQYGSAEVEPRVQVKASHLQSCDGYRNCKCSDKNTTTSRHPSCSFVALSYNEVGTKPLVAAILHRLLRSCAENSGIAYKVDKGRPSLV
jgi:hypothetical protein